MRRFLLSSPYGAVVGEGVQLSTGYVVFQLKGHLMPEVSPNVQAMVARIHHAQTGLPAAPAQSVRIVWRDEGTVLEVQPEKRSGGATDEKAPPAPGAAEYEYDFSRGDQFGDVRNLNKAPETLTQMVERQVSKIGERAIANLNTMFSERMDRIEKGQADRSFSRLQLDARLNMLDDQMGMLKDEVLSVITARVEQMAEEQKAKASKRRGGKRRR